MFQNKGKFRLPRGKPRISHQSFLLLRFGLPAVVGLAPRKVGEHGGGERGQATHVRGAHDAQAVVGSGTAVVAGAVVVGVVVEEVLDGGQGSRSSRGSRRFRELSLRRSGRVLPVGQLLLMLLSPVPRRSGGDPGLGLRFGRGGCGAFPAGLRTRSAQCIQMFLTEWPFKLGTLAAIKCWCLQCEQSSRAKIPGNQVGYFC